MPLLQSVCLGLRLASLFLVGVMNVREYIPGSVDSRQPVAPVTDTDRYMRGEMRWHDYRDDVKAIDTKMEMCEKNAVNASFGRRLGCWVQRRKLAVWRFHLCLLKNVVGFTVNLYESQRIALTGPSAVLHFIKLLFTIASLTYSVYKLYMYRTIIWNAARGWIQRQYHYYLPPTSEPPRSVAVSPPYISETTRALLSGARLEDIGSVSSSSLLAPRPLEDAASELGVPARGSFHSMSSDDTSDYVLPPCSLPRRQQSSSVDDDSPVIDVGIGLDAADLSGARGVCHAESRGRHVGDGAEPVTISGVSKKRVAFNEDVVESRPVRGGRRGALEFRDDATSLPQPRAAPRVGRSGPRGRRVGAGAGRRQPSPVYE